MNHRHATRRHDPIAAFRCRPVVLSLTAMVACIALVGCGYMVGSPNSARIRSVHVPIFTSDALRRGLEYQLTEAVQQEIKNRPHFRVVNNGDADTILRGHIIDIRKNVLGETRFDDPRELQYAIAVAVVWEDSRTGEILGQTRIPVGQNAQHILSQADFAPEVGHSLATATHDSVNRIATQVVDMMETPW